MKENELEYYYPYRVDKTNNYRMIQDRINSEDFIGEDPFFDYQISGGIDEIGAYISNDFSYWSMWNTTGRNIFSFSTDLLLMLEKTDVDNISYEMFSFPYDNFYLSLTPLQLQANYEGEGIIDGVYVHVERFEMEALAKSDRDPNMPDNYYEPEYNLLIYFQFVGNFDNIIRDKPEDLVFREDILLSWGYALSFPTEGDHITVGDAITQEIEKFEEQVKINFNGNPDKQKRLVDDYRSFVNRTLRVLVNSLLYLSQPNEKVDKLLEYPNDLPLNFNRKLKFAKTLKEKNKIEKKISETGFSKILFFGRSEQRNVYDYAEYNKKSMHWRRGHWRKQPFGESLQKNRMIWIRPVLVNKTDDGGLPKGHVYDVKNN